MNVDRVYTLANVDVAELKGENFNRCGNNGLRGQVGGWHTACNWLGTPGEPPAKGDEHGR